MKEEFDLREEEIPSELTGLGKPLKVWSYYVNNVKKLTFYSRDSAEKTLKEFSNLATDLNKILIGDITPYQK